MATKQTKHAKRQEAALVNYQAGVSCTAVFTFDFATEGLTAASDRVEMGMLPADAQLIGLAVVGTAGLGAITATVGIMDGEFGDASDARTVATALITAQSVNGTEGGATRAACLGVAPAATHRSIGATLSGNVAAGANKRLTVIAEYVF